MVPWQSLVGRPYAFPSAPPESFDCWTLVRYVRGLKGLPCPLPFDDGEPWCRPGALSAAIAKARDLWRVGPEASPFAMAVLEPEHVGVCIEGGVLHAMSRGATVVWTGRPTIQRVWPRVEYWQA